MTAGVRVAWRRLEAELRPFIARRVGGEADVNDVVQDVFLRIQRGLPHLRDEQRFGAWVYQIARNAISDHNLRMTRHPLAAAPAGELAVEEEDDLALEREMAAHIAPLVALLPSPYREALTLTELEGLTQKQAAAMLGLSFSGMKSRVQRGRARLREAFEACCDIALDTRGRAVSCEPRARGPTPRACCAPPRGARGPAAARSAGVIKERS